MAGITLFVGFVSAPLCGVVPALVAEVRPEAAGAAMGFQKSSEQLGIFVGPSLAGIVSAATVGAGAVMVLGSVVFLLLVKEPAVSEVA